MVGAERQNEIPMTDSGPLTASIEDVKALLADNRSLSVALLAHRIRDLEEEVRRRFREIHCPCEQVAKAEAAIEKLEQRLGVAAMKFKEMREEVDLLKAEVIHEEANRRDKSRTEAAADARKGPGI